MIRGLTQVKAKGDPDEVRQPEFTLNNHADRSALSLIDSSRFQFALEDRIVSQAFLEDSLMYFWTRMLDSGLYNDPRLRWQKFILLYIIIFYIYDLKLIEKRTQYSF